MKITWPQALEAVDTTLLAHPEWDPGEVRTWAEWEALTLKLQAETPWPSEEEGEA